MPINQNHMIPKLPSNSPNLNYSLNRDDFLNGTIKTYFAPGQFPFGMTDINGYSNPTNWNPAGTILRVPQQVVISFWIFPYFLFSGNPNNPDLAFSYPPDFDYITMAIEVKSIIKNLRSGLTFVDLVMYVAPFDTNPLQIYGVNGNNTGQGAFPYTIDYITQYFTCNNVYVNPSSSSYYYPHLTIPDPSEDYFGTNFLHLFAGSSNQNGDNSFPYPNQDQFYKNGRTRIVGSYPKFAGYSVYMYSVPWTTLGYTSYFDIGAQKTINLFNHSNPSNNIIATCIDLVNYGYQYGGDAASNMTVDNVTNLIANYYNFDISTGLDLPSSTGG